MGETCSTQLKIKIWRHFGFKNTERKEPVGRNGRKWKDNIKMNLK